MWFRSDLRVSDNTALRHACRSAQEGVIAVFAACPAQWSDHGWGSMKVNFILRNLQALSRGLSERNIPLLLVESSGFAAVPPKILEIARRYKCGALFFNEEHEVNEQRRDAIVRTLFAQVGLAVYSFTDQTILDVSRLRTGSGSWYTVFTPFKRKWLETATKAGPLPICARPRKQTSTAIASDPVPVSLRGFAGPDRADLWPAGEQEAQKRLRRFVSQRIGDYHVRRDFPGEPGTSELSPYLACGVLSARQCLAAALEANDGRLDAGDKGVTTWISELIWREFYRHILIGFPRVCMNRPFRLETDGLAWREDETQFRAWCAGRTGVPIVDAGMRQLTQTGWMHNRVRMIAAMFLTKDLFIDWRWGERHFMQHLVDGDFASNNGGWQWSASTGTDAAPYFRIFNPFSQSRRYDPDGDYIRRFVPELADVPTAALHDAGGIQSLGVKYAGLTLDRAAGRDRVLSAFKSLRRQRQADID
jgi:deoxyribodipyrimidine photo-lyase